MSDDEVAVQQDKPKKIVLPNKKAKKGKKGKKGAVRAFGMPP